MRKSQRTATRRERTPPAGKVGGIARTRRRTRITARPNASGRIRDARSHDGRTVMLSHLGSSGEARMVDVSLKPITSREAIASARIRLRRTALDALVGGTLPKGDALATARIAGIQAAKRTSEWIPLCHPMTLDDVRIEFQRLDGASLGITCRARTAAKTGVEMEALVGVCAAALCVYDMAKAADKTMVIGPIQLERKSGGRSGTYQRRRSSHDA